MPIFKLLFKNKNDIYFTQTKEKDKWGFKNNIDLIHKI